MPGKALKIAASAVVATAVCFGTSATAGPEPLEVAVDAQVRLAMSVDQAQMNKALLVRAKSQIVTQEQAVIETQARIDAAHQNVGQMARDIAHGNMIESDPLVRLAISLSSGETMEDFARQQNSEERVSSKFGSDLTVASSQHEDAVKALDKAKSDVERLDADVRRAEEEAESAKRLAATSIQALAVQETGAVAQTTTIQQSVLNLAAEKVTETPSIGISTLVDLTVSGPGADATATALSEVQKVVVTPEPEPEATETLPITASDAPVDPPAVVEVPQPKAVAYPCVAVVSDSWPDAVFPDTPLGILNATTRVEVEDILPGDLVFEFEPGSETPHGVGIYTGGGQMVSTMMGVVAVEPWGGSVVTRPSLGVIEGEVEGNQPGERLACGDISATISPAAWVVETGDPTTFGSHTGGVVVSVNDNTVVINHGYGFMGTYVTSSTPQVREGQIVLPDAPLAPSGDQDIATITSGDRVINPTDWDVLINPDGSSNGMLPDSSMCLINGLGTMMRCDAARGMEMLREAYQAEMGSPMVVSGTYRTLAGQISLKIEKPVLAGTPGTSIHGWGLAADFSGGIENLGTPAHNWMVANAAKYGWEHPAWAQADGSKPEAWHWEFGASRLKIKDGTATMSAPAPTDEHADEAPNTETEGDS